MSSPSAKEWINYMVLRALLLQVVSHGISLISASPHVLTRSAAWVCFVFENNSKPVFNPRRSQVTNSWYGWALRPTSHLATARERGECVASLATDAGAVNGEDAATPMRIGQPRICTCPRRCCMPLVLRQRVQRYLKSLLILHLPYSHYCANPCRCAVANGWFTPLQTTLLNNGC